MVLYSKRGENFRNGSSKQEEAKKLFSNYVKLFFFLILDSPSSRCCTIFSEDSVRSVILDLPLSFSELDVICEKSLMSNNCKIILNDNLMYSNFSINIVSYVL